MLVLGSTGGRACLTCRGPAMEHLAMDDPTRPTEADSSHPGHGPHRAPLVAVADAMTQGNSALEQPDLEAGSPSAPETHERHEDQRP